MWPFNKEKRNVQEPAPVVQPQPTVTISSLAEQDPAILSLVFGKYAIGNEREMTLSAVFRAVSLISNSLASLPIFTYKVDENDNKTEWKEHPLYNLLYRKPNNIQTRFDFIKSLVKDMLLRGNGYAIIHRNPNNQVVKLEYVPASKVTIQKYENPDGGIDYVRYNISGRKRLYESSEMIHIINEPDEDGVEGLSTLKYAMRTIGLAKYAEAAAEGYFSNGGKLTGIVKVDRPLNDKQKMELKNEWKKSLDTNGIAFLQGVENYTSIQQNSEEAQLLESRQFSISEIARFFNVNPIMLYDLSHNNYNSSEAARLQLLTDTLQPIMFKIEAELETKLFLPSESNIGTIKFDTDEFLRSDNKTKAEYYKVLWQIGALSINEIRSFLDFNDIEDGDIHYVPANLVTLENSKNIGYNTETSNKRHPERDENEDETKETDEESE